MNLTFLGTAAAPSMPIPFCTCKVCTEARRIGGKNLRGRSSLVINDDLLADIGPDIATASFQHRISLAGIGLCLQTHPHADHLASKDVAAHADRFRECGLLKDNGVVYATHLSHEGNLEHDALDEYAREHGYQVAYDELRLKLGD